VSILSGFIFGNFDQRFSSKLYIDLFYNRIFTFNLGGIVGIIVLATSFFYSYKYKIKILLISSLFLFLIPIYIFTNLHIVHDYYSSESLIFLIFLISIILNRLLHLKNLKPLISVIIIVIVFSNIHQFSGYYLNGMRSNPQTLSYVPIVANYLKANIDDHKTLLIFGNDWNPNINYLAQKKGFNVPFFYKNYNSIARNPQDYVAIDEVGAIVVCNNTGYKNPSYNAKIPNQLDYEYWKKSFTFSMVTVEGCDIALIDDK